MDKLTEKQAAILSNLAAFHADFNFPRYEIRTEKPYGARRWYYVVPVDGVDPKRPNESDYIYATDNIDNLNGWLYGAVQAVNIMKRG